MNIIQGTKIDNLRCSRRRKTTCWPGIERELLELIRKLPLQPKQKQLNSIRSEHASKLRTNRQQLITNAEHFQTNNDDGVLE